MSAYIELHLVGGGAAVIEAGMIAGVNTADGTKVTDSVTLVPSAVITPAIKPASITPAPPPPTWSSM